MPFELSSSVSLLFSAYYCAYYRPPVTKNVPVLSLTSLVARCRTWGLCFSQHSNSTSMYVECGEWKWYAYNIRARLNIKTVFPCIGRDSRYKDNTVVRPCCLSDGNAYLIGKTTSCFEAPAMFPFQYQERLSRHDYIIKIRRRENILSLKYQFLYISETSFLYFAQLDLRGPVRQPWIKGLNYDWVKIKNYRLFSVKWLFNKSYFIIYSIDQTILNGCCTDVYNQNVVKYKTLS